MKIESFFMEDIPIFIFLAGGSAGLSLLPSLSLGEFAQASA